MTSPMLAAAVRYAGLNIAVFPLRPRTKQPYGRTIGLHMASADVRTAEERWAGRWALPLQPIETLRAKNKGRSDDWLLRPVKASPAANVAIATGKAAGFWVLDEDGPEAVAWVAAKEAEHGPLPETVEQRTARGRHRCFKWDEAAAAADISNRSQLSGAPLDVRGDGGYIVAAPSVHPGDEKKGVPPGFVYHWAPGRAPWEIDFAPAPAWLVALVKPKAAEVRSSGPVEPRIRAEGRASAYGEAALDRVVATISAAVVGTRDSTLYSAACSIGRLVAGGEIDHAYARSALISAGAVHVPDAMSEAQLERQVDRALDFGGRNPKAAGERRADRWQRRPAPKSPRPGRDATLSETELAADLWGDSRPALGSPVELYLRALGIVGEPLSAAVAQLRFHPAAPTGAGPTMPAMIGLIVAPLGLMARPTRGVIATYLAEDGDLVWRRARIERPVRIWGDAHLDPDDDRPARWGGVWLTSPTADGPLLVGRRIEAVLSAAMMAGDPVRAVATLTLDALQGGWAEDAYGRVDADAPGADPQVPAFFWPEPEDAPWGEVRICLDRNLPAAERRARKAGGGTWKRPLDSEARAAVCASLAEQHWRRAGANAVRVWAPAPGRDFNDELRARTPAADASSLGRAA